MSIDADIHGEPTVRELVWYKDRTFFVTVYWANGRRELIYAPGGGLSADHVKFPQTWRQVRKIPIKSIFDNCKTAVFSEIWKEYGLKTRQLRAKCQRSGGKISSGRSRAEMAWKAEQELICHLKI